MFAFFLSIFALSSLKMDIKGYRIRYKQEYDDPRTKERREYLMKAREEEECSCQKESDSEVLSGSIEGDLRELEE